MSPAVLLERGSQLAELAAAWGSVESGEGRLLLISGEAGVGKSSLVRHFASAGPPERVLFGACDPLETPAPLGPLLEMGGGLGPEVGELLAAPAPGGRLLVALADELRRSTRLAVVEDVHWADQATLDALRYLGRRATQLRVLLLVTFRTEEMTSPSGRRLLGDVAVKRWRDGSMIKRWRDGSMILRWTAAGVLEAEKQFRRVNGYRDLQLLWLALERTLPAEEGEVAATG